MLRMLKQIVTNCFEAEAVEPDLIDRGRNSRCLQNGTCAQSTPNMQHLSAASIRSLELQGGLMLNEEVRDFEQNPLHKDRGAPAAVGRWGQCSGSAGPRVGDVCRDTAPLAFGRV
jgi:hypothetical protein